MSKLQIKAFFDDETKTVTYVVFDRLTKDAAIIDPVFDFNMASGELSTDSADTLIQFINESTLNLNWILETHAHADHITSATYLQQKCGGKIGIGEHIKDVHDAFGETFNCKEQLTCNIELFDCLFKDGDVIELGQFNIAVIHTPGHTPACVSYKIEDNVFVGDTLFMPDFGTARADFPGGDAKTLYRSIQRILSLPDDTKIYVGHDYKSPDRAKYAWESTVAEQKRCNVHVRDGKSEREFVQMRSDRDAELAVPKLLFPSIQLNIRAGTLPIAEDNGIAYVKVPLSMSKG